MRDPNRIKTFCTRLENLWRRVPDWRFGQFVWNIISDCQSQGKDVFYMEDDELIQTISRYIKQINGDNIGAHDCRDCRHGHFNDHWNTHLCYNPEKCEDWDHWEPKEEND